jgi:dihydrofolate reductase
VGRIVAVEYVSIDGVVQAPGHPDEDSAGGFNLGGWAGPFIPEHGRYMPESFRAADAFLFGRLTYDIWAPVWPAITDPDNELAHILNTRPKYVVSRTLTDPQWDGTTVIAANDVAKIRDAHTRDIVMMGSAELAQTLIRDDIIDRYELWVHPVVLGDGKRLFRDVPPPSELKLVDTRVTASGLVFLGYERA